MSDVFEGFGSVLSADVEEDFFAAAREGRLVWGMGGGEAEEGERVWCAGRLWCVGMNVGLMSRCERSLRMLINEG